MNARAVVAPCLALLIHAVGCDKEPTKLEQLRAAASAPPSVVSSAPAAPEPPKKPPLAIDDSGASIGGDRVDFGTPDVKGRLGGALSGKRIEGEQLVLEAARDTKVPKVASVFAALGAAKAKAVVVRTAKRDKTMAEIPFKLGVKRPDCAAVGFIGKDGAISTWPASGATATRFAHGMAGPDLTLGAPGVRKTIAACDGDVWAVSADDNATWGLLVDLILAVHNPEDAGAPLKKDVVLLTTRATPGRKVEDE